MDWIYLARYGSVVGSCDRSDEALGYVKCREFVD